MSRAIALLAGMGAGFLDEDRRLTDRKRADDRLAKEDARTAVRDKREEENYEYLKGERAQITADRAALRDAAAPQVVTEEQLAGPPVDDATPMPTAYKVGGRAFAERGVAAEAATAANAPDAVRSRIATTLAQQDPVKADQYRATGLQTKVAELQLTEADRVASAKKFDDGLSAAAQRGPQGVIEFTNASGAAPTQSQFVVGPDGKTGEVVVIGEDGTQRPTGMKYSNDAAGARNMALDLARMVPLDAKLKHYQAEAESTRRAAHDAGQLKIAQQNADTQAGYRRDQAAHNRAMQAAATAKATAGPGPVQLTLKDKREFESDLSGHIKDLYPTKDGVDAAEKASINAQATAKMALGNTLFQNNAQIGIPLTAATVLQAMELAADRKNVKIARVAGVPHESVLVNGQVVITSGPLQERPPAGPVAAPGATPQPGQGVINADIRSAPPGSYAAPTGAAGRAAQGVQPQEQGPSASELSPATMARIQPLNDAVNQAAQAMAAAAKSADPVAIKSYATRLEAARTQRDQEVLRQLGPMGAREYLASLPA